MTDEFHSITDEMNSMTEPIRRCDRDVRKDDNRSTIPGLLGMRKAAEIRDFYKLRAINELSNLPGSVDSLTDLVERICV